MASISCSVILMISCFLTVGRKDPPIYLLGNFPRGKRALLCPSGSPCDLCQRRPPPLSFKALCRRSKPTLLLTPFLASEELRTSSFLSPPSSYGPVTFASSPSTTRLQKTSYFLAAEEPVMSLTLPLVRVCVLAGLATLDTAGSLVSNHFLHQKGLIQAAEITALVALIQWSRA